MHWRDLREFRTHRSHVQQTCKNCATKEQEGQPAELLNHYQIVFSNDNQAVGQTELVYHSIPTAEGARPI